MPVNESSVEASAVANALALAGRNERLREVILEALRAAELDAENAVGFRSEVRWPLVSGLLADAKQHAVALQNGLVFEVGLESRIEQALLLSSEAHPDHVWEPQTTKLLLALAAGASHVIVGGAYIGDHVLPLARTLALEGHGGVVHAFEPMEISFRRLLRNLEKNAIRNVVAHRLGLWDASTSLALNGPAALASSMPTDTVGESGAEVVSSTTIDDYVANRELPSVRLIMLDTEGGEERALCGASRLLQRPGINAPHVVFEVHRQYVNWSSGLQNTSIVKRLTDLGYEVFAVRDLHDNHPMGNRPVEIIPADRVYLEGPPHGFNMLASKDTDLVRRLGLSVVSDVSPKLLIGKDPALHHPLDGFGSL